MIIEVYNFLCQLKEIFRVAKIGLKSKREPSFVPQKPLLIRDCYEKQPVIYKVYIESRN